MKKICIIAHLKKRKVKSILPQLISWLKRRKLELLVNEEKEEKLDKTQLIVALGGNGTILKVARLWSHLAIPVLGINLGGLGFLSEIELKDTFKTLSSILEGNYKIEERSLLEAKIWRKEKKIENFTALNDIVIKNGQKARVIKLELEINSQYVATYIGDGIIISTPTGSTAYSLATSGPIACPQLPVWIISAICPHTLSLRPLIVSQNSQIKISSKTNHQEVILSADGQESIFLEVSDQVKIKKAKHKLKLIVSPKKNYFEVLRTKLKWGKR